MNAKHIKASEPNDSTWTEIVGQALPPAILAGLLGVFTGMLVSEYLAGGQNTLLFSATFASFSSLFVYLFVYFMQAITGRTNYEAALPQPPQFVRTGDSHTRHVSTNGDMQDSLVILGRHYPTIGTLAINQWSGVGKPLTRGKIEELRAYLIHIKAAVQNEDGTVELTDMGIRRLPYWAREDFDTTPPLPDGRPTHALD